MTADGAGFGGAALETYLTERLGAAVTGTELLHDGLNLTVGISTTDADRAYVLRRPNKLRHTGFFNDLRTEYRVLELLDDTALPTPAPVLFCADASVIGDPFLVTTYLEGDPIPMGSTLPERFPDERVRRAVAEHLVDTLVEVGSLDVGSFEGVCERRKPLEQVDTAVDRLDRVRAVTGRDHPTLREVAGWLRRNPPAEPGRALVHGDFKPGNVFLAGDGPPEVTGVLDWETATVGDPLTELGYLLLYWRDSDDPTPALDELEARYSGGAMADVREINRNGFYPFATLPGSPTRRELVDRYEERAGVRFDDDRFYRAHAALGLATVWADLHRHQFEAGAESDYEPLIDYMSLLAARIVDGEFPL